MPPRSVRTKPLTSPQRQLRHFRLKRSQILCALGKSSFINGSQFAILLVEPSGDSEVFGSGAFKGRLGTSGGWFANGLLGEARELAAAAARARQFGRARADVFCASGAVIPVEADADDGFVGRAGEEDWDDDEDEVWSEEAPSRSAFAILEGGVGRSSRPNSATALHPHHQVAPSSAPSSSLISFATSASAPVSPSIPDTRVTRSLSMLAVNEAPSHPSPADSHHSPPAPSSSGPSGSSHTKVTPTVRPVVFTPTTLSAWYTEKFVQLQPKAQNIVCPKWIAVVEEHVASHQTVEGLAPPWWPGQITFRNPKNMQKHDRVALLAYLIHGLGVPISSFEAATASTEFTPAKTATLADIYKVAREEERVLRANNNALYDFITVILPVSNLNPASDISPSEQKPTRHRTRRSIASATLPIDDEVVRAHVSHAPYPLSRSHSAMDVPTESSRPLARSHSISGYSKREQGSSGGGRPRKPRTSMGMDREEQDRQYQLEQTRDGQSPRVPVPGSLLYEYPQHFNAPSPSLKAPILLYSQPPPHDEPLDHRRHSHEGTPCQAPRLAQDGTSHRMQHSPSEGAYGRSRSQQNEPSFASPAMIKSRSRNIGAAMGSIAESPQHDLVNAAPVHRPFPVQVHPGHDFHPYQYSGDYPTPSYAPSNPQYQPPRSLPAHQEVIEDHHQRQQSRHDRELLRRHAENLQAQQNSQFLLDRDLEAQQMALQQQQYAEEQRQHQHAAFYYTNEDAATGYGVEHAGYGLMPASFDMAPQGSQHELMELGLGGIAGAYPDIAAVELFEQERRKDTSRRYDEIMYGVQA